MATNNDDNQGAWEKLVREAASSGSSGSAGGNRRPPSSLGALGNSGAARQAAINAALYDRLVVVPGLLLRAFVFMGAYDWLDGAHIVGLPNDISYWQALGFVTLVRAAFSGLFRIGR